MDAFEPTDDEIDDDFPSQDHRRNIHQFYSNTSNNIRVIKLGEESEKEEEKEEEVPVVKKKQQNVAK